MPSVPRRAGCGVGIMTGPAPVDEEVCPVMNAASSDTRNEMVPVRSSGHLDRLIACIRGTMSKNAAGPVSVVPVRTGLGPTALTVMPASASSVARPRVSPMTAILLAM